MPEAMKTPTRSAMLRRHRQPRVIDGELRGGERVLDEDVHLLDVFLVDELERIEALDLAGDARRVLRRVEAGDRRRSRSAPRTALPSLPAVPMPSGDTSPTPVTTTRLLMLSF